MTPRICVNMIVKDEAHGIEECCRTLAGLVDCYVICDTGSTDDTPMIIKRAFEAAGVPGEVHHISFYNFEQARNEALDAARRSPLEFDYLLFCDADMEFYVVDPHWKDQLSGPAYRVMQREITSRLEYANVRLLQRSTPARYIGVTHEYLDVGDTAVVPTLGGAFFFDHVRGSSRGDKINRDIRLLTEALQLEPDNARYVFYLANSYFDGRHFEQAIHWYQQRIALGGWVEEVFMSRYRIGLAAQQLGRISDFYRMMLEIFDEFPHRAEPLHALGLHAQQEGRHRLARAIATIGIEISKPADGLFVEAEVYEWRLADIVAVALYWMGRYDEAREINEELLKVVPEFERARIAANLAFCNR